MRKLVVSLLVSFFVSSLNGSESIHVVQKNQTLGGIARKYGVSIATLQAYNSITDPNLLFAGKKLKIPVGKVRKISYTVKKGDSLGSIAVRFNIALSTLTSVNEIKRPDLIKVGQKLIIPLSNGIHGPITYQLDSSTLTALNKIKPKFGKWKRIVIHHSATPVDDPLNMHRVHKARGMKNGLAYHFVISNGSRKASDGEVYLGDRWKQQLDGGHMKKLSWNQTSIGICLIGNFELRAPTSSQLKSLEGLCEYLMKTCKINSSQVTTHKILHKGHTACPGKYFSLPSFIKRISS